MLRKRRRGIHPVLATVILIAITLVAAIAIAGFVFGLFGSFTNSAQVSAVAGTCSITSNNCAVDLQNDGSSNATPTACSLMLGGARTPCTTTAFAQVTAEAGTTSETRGVASVGNPTLGSTAQGSFTMSNGATVTLTSTWSA